MGKEWKPCQTLLFWAPKSRQMVIAAMKSKDAYSLEGKLWPTYVAYSRAEALLCQQRSVYSRLWFFQWSCMDVRVGLWRKLSTEDWCFWTVVLEKTLESPLDFNKIQPFHPKEDQSWVFIGRTDAEAETPILWPLWCWERLRAEGEGDDRGWDGWMASPTRWTWVWVNSGSWWWTGRPGMLQVMGLQRVGHDWVTELNWITCL